MEIPCTKRRQVNKDLGINYKYDNSKGRYIFKILSIDEIVILTRKK